MNTELGFIQKLTRLYTFYTPIQKGKYRLALASLGSKRDLPSQIVAKTSDGRTLRMNFDHDSAYFVYFLGEYEPAITNLVKKIIQPGDVCFDIGGNIGWFTTLFQTIVGENGAVHSFEPVPPTFAVLEENVRSNCNSGIVRLNNFALGEAEGEVNLHVFEGFPDGHASIAECGQDEFQTYSSRVTTINSYLSENRINDVTFVKVDIEGAELGMLKGATAFFEQKIPPIFEIEMALNTSKWFGYSPNDIIEFMTGQYNYEFFAINERSQKIEKFNKFDPNDIGANVLCVPEGHYHDRLKALR
jgi:FkbM family methyltransferase